MFPSRNARRGIRLLVGIVPVLALLILSRWNVNGKPQETSVDVQAIVNQFYPQALVEKAEPEQPGNVPLSRLSAFVVYDTFSDGAPRTIIAAYSNGAEGVIRVIQATTARTYSVVFEPTNLLLGGLNCQAELLDVELDGVKEILISFQSFGGPSNDWIFRWDGTQLQSLGPTTTDASGFESSLLSNSSLLDLDHSGPLSLVTQTGTTSLGDEFPTPGNVVYRLTEDRFVLDRPLLLLSPFVRRKGEPETVKESFFLPSGSIGPYTLKLINGERDGSRRVSSARIVLNGVEILSPDHFSQQVEFLSLSVNLQPQNTIEVTLAGIPLGQVWITIQDEAAVERARQGSTQP